ncbi:DotH/IcmK family type IV secretion protein [Pararhizobium sp. BT-229]|uniref:DotH/IcmK family type IV secretion protein n=1 Tax=Pararhizobium sp. BT-229 TaxID=2986923 RepID=UPI0021F735D5|nr:DotH/IcmK family type IV secretion protein [Pararhizobium sp. BT-229]MCV9965075.1 DotH/IcmK family type IV secretion protein [Pararhizobium sp. BT-229]
MNTKFKSLLATAMVWVLSSAAFAQEGGNLLLPPATYPAGQTAQQPVGGMPITAPTAAPTQEELNDKAFKAAIQTMYPLTPEQQKIVREKGDKIDRAIGEPLAPVTPVSRSVRVSLRSGDAPPSIKTSPGWISTITFADVTGQSWPVLSVTNGNPDAYDVKNSGAEGTSNIVTISSKQAYVPSNIAVTLLGAKVPVMITLSPSTGAVDFRVDAQLDQRGPNASLDVISSDSLPATSDSVMLGFLDGVPPSEASKLRTSDANTQAWRYNDLLYIRTTKSLLSPAYLSKQSNVVGVNVYVLNEAPVMVMSGSGDGPDAGRLESVTINR